MRIRTQAKISTETAESILNMLEFANSGCTKKINIEQFRMGLEVEQEHGFWDSCDVTGGDLYIVGKIALAHLKEHGDYYTRLRKAGL